MYTSVQERVAGKVVGSIQSCSTVRLRMWQWKQEIWANAHETRKSP